MGKRNIHALNNLDKKFNKLYNRFEEIDQTFGTDQDSSANIGFDRVIYDLMLRWLRPFVLAIVIEYVNTPLVAVLTNMVI